MKMCFHAIKLARYNICSPEPVIIPGDQMQETTEHSEYVLDEVSMMEEEENYLEGVETAEIEGRDEETKREEHVVE